MKFSANLTSIEYFSPGGMLLRQRCWQALRRWSEVRLLGLFAIVPLMVLSGCATVPISLNYAPSSVKTVSGSLSVGDFKYLPADPSNSSLVASNQIRNTALGSIILNRDVKDVIRDAVFAELRLVGVKVDNHAKMLSGDIEEFLADDLGWSIDQMLRIKYILTDKPSNKIIYQSVKTTQRRTDKFVNPLGAINETIRINIEQLMDDPDFVQAIN